MPNWWTRLNVQRCEGHISISQHNGRLRAGRPVFVSLQWHRV
jgi:hypothetical protein